MRKLMILLGVIVLALAACSDNPPPTQIYIVVSPTPESSTPETPEATPGALPASPSPTGQPAASPSPTAAATKSPAATPLPSATALPPLFPTTTVAEVQIAEQVFEHGRTFWIRHTRQVWVMFNVPADNASGGDWFCYNDTFEEGEPEIDPDLVPPEGMYQPRRGFGKLWRNVPEMRERLGWAVTPEFELTSNYTYIAGGYVEGGTYYPGPGEHRLTTLYNQSISFFEGDIRGDCRGGTWRMTE